MASLSDIHKKTLLSAVCSLALIAILFIIIDNPIQFVPLALMIPLTVYVMSKEKKKKRLDPKKLMNEAPAVIGMISSVISSGGSLDTAVRDVAQNGPSLLARMFTEVVRNTDLRITDIRSGLLNAVSELHNDASAFKRSIHMLISASETSDLIEKKRMMTDAENIALNGLKDLGVSYSTSLNNPCMMIFGLGVMVPMILMSILPMLSIGGLFSVTVLNTWTIAFITLAAIPAVVAVVIFSIVSNNPFSEKRKDDDTSYMMILAVVPLSVILYFLLDDVFNALVISFISSGLLTLTFMYGRIAQEKKRNAVEVSLNYVLFELGSRLSSGENFENALVNALTTRKDCVPLSGKFDRCMKISRGNISDALAAAFAGFSKRLCDAYVRVYHTSCKDTRDAGRLSVSLGHQMQDQMHVKKGIETQLKSMTDMMTGTSAIFAPLIMGLSIILLKPMSTISGSAVDGGVSMILLIYLIELALLISVLTAHLANRGNKLNVAYRFSIIMPVSLILFVMFSGLSV